MLSARGWACTSTTTISTVEECSFAAMSLSNKTLKKIESRSHYQFGCSMCSTECSSGDQGEFFFNRRNISQPHNSHHVPVCGHKSGGSATVATVGTPRRSDWDYITWIQADHNLARFRLAETGSREWPVEASAPLEKAMDQMGRQSSTILHQRRSTRMDING